MLCYGRSQRMPYPVPPAPASIPRVWALLPCPFPLIFRIVKRCPFTIQLIDTSKTFVQEISLGVDVGSKHIGLSATTSKKVLYEADIELRTDIVDNISTRRELRRSRRNRKTRYRQPRFNNRRRKDGWLAPSVQHKVDCHLTVVRKVHEILPVS